MLIHPRWLRRAVTWPLDWWECRYATAEHVMVNREPGTYVLEIDCATGRLPRRHRYLCVEISPELLAGLTEDAHRVLAKDILRAFVEAESGRKP